MMQTLSLWLRLIICNRKTPTRRGWRSHRSRADRRVAASQAGDGLAVPHYRSTAAYQSLEDLTESGVDAFALVEETQILF